MFKKINKTIEYGLYLLVFLLSIQTRWIIRADESEYLTVGLYGTDLLLVMLIVLFIVTKFQTPNHKFSSLREIWREPRQTNSKLQITNSTAAPPEAGRGAGKFQISKIWYLIAGLDLIIFISIFFAQDKLIAVYRYGLFLLGVGLFWLIASAGYNKMKLIYSLLAGIFLQACLAIWQFLTQSDFACKWLGMALHRAGDLGTSVIETLEGERWLRAYGGLDHPNVLGGVLAIGILLGIGLIIKNTKYHYSIRYNNQDTITKKIPIINNQTVWLLVIIFCILVFVVALFFTFSRGAWLGLAVGLLIMFFAAVIKKELVAQKKLLEIILVSSVLIFILFSQFQDLAMTRLAAGARLEVKSNVERMESYKDSWRMIKDNWLLGVGVGNYILRIENQELRIKNNISARHYQPVHNVFLLVWAEIGIIGLLFFIGLLLCVMRLPRYNRQNPLARPACLACARLPEIGNVGQASIAGRDCDETGKRDSAAANLNVKISLLTAITVMFLFDHWWWSLHFGVLFFWLVLGLTASYNGIKIAADNDNKMIIE